VLCVVSCVDGGKYRDCESFMRDVPESPIWRLAHAFAHDDRMVRHFSQKVLVRGGRVEDGSLLLFRSVRVSVAFSPPYNSKCKNKEK
jgi:hypothetical protein